MAFTSNNFTFKNKTIKAKDETKLSQSSYVVELIKFIHKDDDNGFYVAQVKLTAEQPNISETVNGKPFLNRTFSIVGTSLYVVENVKEKQELTVYGNFEDSKGRIQFKVDSLIEVIPKKPKAIQLFLSSGKIKGIGPSIAKKIVDKYGSETIKIFETNPKEFLTIEGITEKKIGGIIESWELFRNVYDIVSTMQFYGVGDANGIKIYEHFKKDALNVIKTDPYRLTEVSMIGFKTADKIAQSIGISHIDPKRIKYCVLYTLEKLAEDGHTAYVYDDLIQKVNEQLNIDSDLIKKELDLLIENKEVINKLLKIKRANPNNRSQIIEGDVNCVAHIKFHNMEKRIAKDLHRIINKEIKKDEKSINQFIDKNTFGLDESQLEATRSILNNKFSILTGGPGTGKTHTIKSILNYFKSVNKKCLLCAPTGRAAKRMEESTGHGAGTMHRTLGFREGKFTFDESNKLDADVIFLDESSMTDTYLTCGFLKAVKDTTIVVLIGDVDQLPSVGAGNVLKDLIECNHVNVVRLNVIHRQAANSNIIKASHQVIKNEMPNCINEKNENSDFIFIEQEDSGNIHDDNNSIYNEIMGLIDNLVMTQKFDKDNIQVLTPRKDTLCGVDEMNKGLKQLLNYSEEYQNDVSKKIKFTNGDRVMQYKNNYDLDIFNGDVGKVIDINFEDNCGLINFDEKIIDVEGNDLNDIKLSYAITIHKSQGSDYPCVIIPISKSHSFMWDSNLLYTAITRGKNQVYLVGDKKTLFMTISKFKQNWRITGLKQEIRNVFNGIEDKLEDNKIKLKI